MKGQNIKILFFRQLFYFFLFHLRFLSWNDCCQSSRDSKPQTFLENLEPLSKLFKTALEFIKNLSLADFDEKVSKTNSFKSPEKPFF